MTCTAAIDVGSDGIPFLVCAKHRIELDGPREGRVMPQRHDYPPARTCPVSGATVIPELEEAGA